MKQTLLFLIIFLSFSYVNLKAQIVLENTYDMSVNITKLETDGYKFFAMDAINNQCLLYNINHSLYKTIDIDIPQNYYLADIQYVTQKLFNDDDLIELLIVYYQYITSSSTPYYEYTTQVINENGVKLINVPGGAYSIVSQSSENTAKLMVYIYDYSLSTYALSTKVYSIYGVPLVSEEDANTINRINMRFPYPNPAESSVILPYDLGECNMGEIIIMNINGKEVKRYKINKMFDKLSIRTSDLGKGIFLYRTVTDTRISPSRKLIVR